jgi:hypothetical protein
MYCRRFVRPAGGHRWSVALGLGLCLIIAGHSHAGGVNVGGSAVGGVSVDASGALKNATVDGTREFIKIRTEMLQRVDDDINRASPLRKVSLKKLEATIRDRQAKAQMPLITEEMNYLAGLTRIQYVFVYPEENDIILVGPAEPLKLAEDGAVVGADSGLPVLHIDHLLVALRTGRSAAQNPITCSIDPTPEGIQALQRYFATRPAMTPQTAQQVEQLMGPQRITIGGVSPESYFARVMVAADYRMKRLAMGMERVSSRVNLPSYLQMMPVSSGGMQNATPRWWLAPNYDAVVRDPDGLAWEFRGQGVKCLTEDSYVTETGGVRASGKSSPAAEKWAQMMTEKYPALSVEFPVFGELRNLMDLAVVGALIAKENLLQKANLQLPILMGTEKLIDVDNDLHAPKTIDTQASVLKKGRNWVISASGGVEISSWHVVDNNTVAEGKTLEGLAQAREATLPPGDTWWWD